MALSLSDLEFLQSDPGQNLLAVLKDEDLSEGQTLGLLTRLRGAYTARQAGAALEMARLRVKAVDKFGAAAERLFFTREALEQASDPLIRRYRAGLAGAAPVVDACCGIGSDALAFAQEGSGVLGLDIDPLRIAIARHNAAALGLENARFEAADVRDGLPEADLIFFDPARRTAEGRRLYDVERYEPPLSVVRGWRARVILVKLSPGVDLAQLAAYPGEVAFISVGGDLKEALLKLGQQGPLTASATLLLAEEVLRWEPGIGQPEVPVSEPRAWLCEPDPSLLRAGLVRDAAVRFGGALLDETIAYFTTAARPQTPWLRAWRILDWMPFNLKRLRAYLRERGIGRVTVKKRGSPLMPEALIPQLKLKGAQACTLVLTRLRDQPVVLICDEHPV